MIAHFRAFYERHFLGIEFVVSGALLLATLIGVQGFWGQQHFLDLLKGSRTPLYSATASIAGALLGFTVTAVSIIFAFADSPRLQYVREGGHYRQLFSIFMGTIKFLGLATALSLIALLWDTDNASKLWLTYAVFWTLLISTLRFVRCVWVLEKVVNLAAPSERTS